MYALQKLTEGTIEGHLVCSVVGSQKQGSTLGFYRIIRDH